MRIAVPVSQGHLEEYFGHCETSAFIDADAETRSILALHTVSAPEHEPGLLPRWLKERQMDIVIAGNMGGRALSNPACFVCGNANPRGLRLHFQASGADGVEAHWAPSPEWEGFQGIVHGGMVSTVLDEAMSKAVVATGCEALTAELRVRFRRPVPS